MYDTISAQKTLGGTLKKVYAGSCDAVTVAVDRKQLIHSITCQEKEYL